MINKVLHGDCLELMNDVDNLQFLTWFENRAKNNLSQEEWNKIKDNIGDYLVWI